MKKFTTLSFLRKGRPVPAVVAVADTLRLALAHEHGTLVSVDYFDLDGNFQSRVCEVKEIDLATGHALLKGKFPTGTQYRTILLELMTETTNPYKYIV